MSLYFFFFKQNTAYEVRISDWSSDVCSSDLMRTNEAAFAAAIADPRATCLTLDGIDFVPGASGGLVWEPLDPADERALMLLGIDDAGAPRFVHAAAAGGRIDARSRTVVPVGRKSAGGGTGVDVQGELG